MGKISLYDAFFALYLFASVIFAGVGHVCWLFHRREKKQARYFAKISECHKDFLFP